MLLQDACYHYAAWEACGRFHINHLRFWYLSCSGVLLTYKQVRDALYRLRRLGVRLQHIGEGFYRWQRGIKW